MLHQRQSIAPSHTSEQKQALRRQFRQRRNALPDRLARSIRICERLSGLSAYQQSPVIHSYLPIQSEVDTRSLLRAALTAGKQVVVPIVPTAPTMSDTSSENILHHALLPSLEPDDLFEGAFGTLQPCTPQWANEGCWQLIVVPMLAFDRMGYRLGYGKGFYDRLLADLGVWKVGVAFAVQEADVLPHEPHDVPLDLIITEDEVITIEQKA